jgi:hypothetical protein
MEYLDKDVDLEDVEAFRTELDAIKTQMLDNAKKHEEEREQAARQAEEDERDLEVLHDLRQRSAHLELSLAEARAAAEQREEVLAEEQALYRQNREAMEEAYGENLQAALRTLEEERAKTEGCDEALDELTQRYNSLRTHLAGPHRTHPQTCRSRRTKARHSCRS